MLVDFVLGHWEERDTLTAPSLRPMNGLALAAVLRAQAELIRPHPVTAFALHSARLDRLSGGIPARFSEQSIARAHNLEWVFTKNETADDVERLVGRVSSLSEAVRDLPESWARDDAVRTQELVSRLLGLDEAMAWAERAWENIEGCRPPIHELSEGSQGLAFLRWLLHRVLPYPCFLWDMQHVAVRFRVTETSLLEAVDRSERLRSALDESRYRGIAHDFLGTRFWRSAVEDFVWRVTEGRSSNPLAIRTQIEALAGSSLEAVGAVQPVICLDGNYRPLAGVIEADTAVRVQPDDWPVYADQAWTTVELARDAPMLNSIVLDEDRKRIA